MALAVLCLLAAVLGAASTKEGSMTMWSSMPDTVSSYAAGPSCNFANKKIGGLHAPTAQNLYIQRMRYCAVNNVMFKRGATCGACYRITFKGNHPRGLGRPGSEVVQVVDSGSGATFDCHMTAFESITGYNTDVFPITYEKVPCENGGGGVVAVLQYHPYFTKFVFGNLRYPVSSAELKIGNEHFPLKRVEGFWAVWTNPSIDGSVTFMLTEEDGSKAVMRHCFTKWQKRHTGDACFGKGKGKKLLDAADLMQLPLEMQHLQGNNSTELIAGQPINNFEGGSPEETRTAHNITGPRGMDATPGLIFP